MCRKFAYSISLIMLLGLIANVQAQPSKIPGWWTEDIGAPTPGDASESDGTFTITGNGHDIWDAADDFYYVYKQLSGDGMMTARVVSHGSGSNTWAKGGVMIRDNNTAGSADAYAVITDNHNGSAGNGAGFQWRDSQGVGAAWAGSGAATAVNPPHWVRLVREGDVFTGYHSANGQDWTELPDPHTVVMEDPVLIGLCVTSHATGELRTYEFDSVTMSGDITDKQPQLKAWEPNPPDGTEGVAIQLLEWTSGETAAFHDIYFGTTPDLGPDDFQRRDNKAMTMYWHIPGLVPGTTYYWRIDEVEADEATVHTGDVWSFTALGPKAYNPNPSDGAEDLQFVTLTWTPGENAAEHRVYLGSNFDAVSNGDPSVDKGTTDEPTYSATDLFGATTYYWRVDETDSGGTTHEGNVWSFTTMSGAPGTAVREWWTGIGGTNIGALTGSPDYPDNPSGSELVDIFEGPTGWMDNYGSRISGWLIPPETAEYTFWICTDDNGQLWLSTDADPANATMISQVTAWAASREFDDPDVVPSDPIALEAGKKYYIEGLMKEGGGGDNISAAWQGGPIEARTVIDGDYLAPTPYELVTASNPSPADGATDVMEAPILEWNAGADAAQHDVYFGTDADAVANADTTTTGVYRGRQNMTSFPPGVLQWDTTHYWRIDEVNNLNPDSPWPGSVWSFTTADFMIVDDFEDYNDFTPDRVWQTWLDGYGYNEPPPGYGGNGSGSQVGNDDPPFTEQGTVHGGLQAMTFRYTNDGSTGKAMYSETEREFAIPQDWTKNGVKSLSLWFNGDAANSAERLYVGVQDSLGTRKDVPHENANAVLLAGWQEFHIDLQEFANAGVNLTSVKKMFIGVGNRLSPQMGGTGTLYFDDIRVYKPRCVWSEAKPAASFNNDCIVNDEDLQIMADAWLMQAQNVPEPAWNGAFTSQDIGTPSVAGSYSFDGSTYTIHADGNDIWGNADNFHYAYRQISGDTQMTVRVTRVDAVNGWAKAGIMIRDTLDAGSPNAMVAITGGSGNGGTFQWRTDADVASGSSRTLTGISPPACVRLVREGDTFTGYIFLDGKWQQEGTSTTVAMTDPVYVGLAVTSHTDGTLTTATFDRVCTFSGAELYEDGVIDFKDYAVFADNWLNEVLWP
jgi:hypothetical protein